MRLRRVQDCYSEEARILVTRAEILEAEAYPTGTTYSQTQRLFTEPLMTRAINMRRKANEIERVNRLSRIIFYSIENIEMMMRVF